ncbi:MAG: DUF370 domain-containing protein [Ruminococcaceae bacterium]|nr:DUF370 domain-containing protein [Oscillospiraceae bacterium]
MYLQIGSEKFIEAQNIIGIFDLDNTTVQKSTREYLKIAEKSGETETVSYDLPKSFIVSLEKGERKVYIASYSTNTLLKRINEKNELHGY